MLEIERKRYVFKTKEIWFSDYPYDVDDYHNVTFRACKNKIEMNGFNREDFTTLVIDLTSDSDTLWKNMDNSSCRRRIKRAERDGVKIKLDQNYEEFYAINQSFKEEKELPLEPLEIDFMKKYGTLFVEEFDGKIIGGHFYLKDEGNMRSLIASSKRLEVSKEMASLIGNANRLVIWHAMQYAKEKGIREFDLGGYYKGKERDEQKERINIFKESFGGKATTHYIYRKDYSSVYKIINKIYKLKQRCLK